MKVKAIIVNPGPINQDDQLKKELDEFVGSVKTIYSITQSSCSVHSSNSVDPVKTTVIIFYDEQVVPGVSRLK